MIYSLSKMTQFHYFRPVKLNFVITLFCYFLMKTSIIFIDNICVIGWGTHPIRVYFDFLVNLTSIRIRCGKKIAQIQIDVRMWLYVWTIAFYTIFSICFRGIPFRFFSPPQCSTASRFGRFVVPLFNLARLCDVLQPGWNLVSCLRPNRQGNK